MFSLFLNFNTEIPDGTKYYHSMEEVKYIMVTHWVRHWDDLQNLWNNSTLFTIGYIKDGIVSMPFPVEATTLFIKNDTGGNFERSWIGTAKNFRNDPNNGKPAIRFDVADLQEIPRPTGLKNYSSGWYLNKDKIFIESPLPPINYYFVPPFFEEMQHCTWKQFEWHCFQLLRLIGIHDIHALPSDKQPGKADGFFCFGALSVIYDATINTDFQTTKEQQIDNYIQQLKKEKFEFHGSNRAYNLTIKNTHKQVWLITRGEIARTIIIEDDIHVKEVPYTKLIQVYNRRLSEEIGSSELEEILKNVQ